MCFSSPIRNDPKKKKKKLFGTHPVPGQSRKFVYVYVFFSFPESTRPIPGTQGTSVWGSEFSLDGGDGALVIGL